MDKLVESGTIIHPATIKLVLEAQGIGSDYVNEAVKKGCPKGLATLLKLKFSPYNKDKTGQLPMEFLLFGPPTTETKPLAKGAKSAPAKDESSEQTL